MGTFKHVGIVPDQQPGIVLSLQISSILSLALQLQIKKSIPIVSVVFVQDLFSYKDLMTGHLEEGIQTITQNNLIAKHQIKVTFLGKWYDLPGTVIEKIKDLIDETKDNDRFFFNICLNYNGQEEILDAVRLITKQISSGKISPDQITHSVLKENLYTSYFVPPDVLVITGKKKSTHGALLWDSKHARLHFIEKHAMDITLDDFSDI